MPPNICGECPDVHTEIISIVPCPPIPPIGDQEITIESGCPDRVNLPGASRPRSIGQWVKALADQFCTLNPVGLRGSKPCQIVTTVTDPRGGSMLEARDVLDTLNCAPFSKSGQGFIYDGSKVTIASIAPSIDKLIELKDGPESILPGAFLMGTSTSAWGWKSGCLPPCPTAPGLVLQSTTEGGLVWGPLAPPGLKCSELRSKLVTCIKPSTEFPDRLIGTGPKDGDVCNIQPASYNTCDIIRKGLKTCLTPKSGKPEMVVGFDANGDAFKYTLGAGLDCATMKSTFPLVTTRALELYGTATDGTCARFTRECDVNFRASARPALDVSTGNRLIRDWATNSLYAVMTPDYNIGTCQGAFTGNATAGGLAFYTIATAGRYAIEASQWVNVRFDASGPGQIHSDAVWAILMAIVVSKGGNVNEYRLGESSDSIDYITDPGGTYTVNNCTKGLTSVGMDFFFSRTLILELPAGSTISVPRARVNNVHNAADIGVTIRLETDGESTLSVTKLASHSF